MNEKALFTKFWTDESRTTLKVLARIPEGSDYRPDPKSRTAQEIAWQIVCEEKMMIEALESGKAEWAPPPIAPALAGAAARALGWRARVSSSTSFIIGGRLRLTCGRWDLRCPRSTDRAGTNREQRARPASGMPIRSGHMGDNVTHMPVEDG